MFLATLVTFLMLPVYLGWLVLLVATAIVPSLLGLTLIALPFFLLRNSFRIRLPSDLRINGMAVVDDGTPLVNFSSNFPGLNLAQPTLINPGPIRGRPAIGRMLLAAESTLVTGYKLQVVECYRSNQTHNTSFSDSDRQTGGFVDVTLTNTRGEELDLGMKSPKKMNWIGRPKGEVLSKKVRTNRRLLANAMNHAGFVNDPREWWNWSYGGKFWCALTKSKNAIYDEVNT